MAITANDSEGSVEGLFFVGFVPGFVAMCGGFGYLPPGKLA